MVVEATPLVTETSRNHLMFRYLRGQLLQPISNNDFFDYCQQHRDWQIERSKLGEIIFMAPAGGDSGSKNLSLESMLWTWAQRDKSGVAFDSSTGFTLPNGAVRSPDAAWVRRERLTQLTPEQKRKFLPLCPDFVIELRSPSDKLTDLQEKMAEYLENGLQLGWLIDPDEKKVYVYRPSTAVECLENAMEISGEPVLPGFMLDLEIIWQPAF